nr:MAG TPA: hypothetical protein [Caudoviricetes sp.]
MYCGRALLKIKTNKKKSGVTPANLYLSHSSHFTPQSIQWDSINVSLFCSP